MLVQHLHRLDAVNAVDGGKQVVWVIEVHLVFQKGRQVEVILRKHDAYRLHPALHQLRILHALIRHLDDPLIPHGLSQRPQRVQNVLAMVGRDVVELFIGHQRPHVPLVLRRHGAVDELVQNGQHVIRRERAALQQDLAHRQHLAVCQAAGITGYHAVALQVPVIDHVLLQVPLSEKTAQILHVPLDAPGRDMKILR